MAGPIDPLFWQVARWLLFGVFAVALWHKLRARESFIVVVDDYRLLPRKAASAAAATVMGLEALVLAGLCFDVSVRPAAILAVVLLGIYASAIAVNLLRGRRDIDCGCMGPAGGSQDRHRLSEWLLLRNAALIGLGAVVLLPVSGRELLWLDAAGIVTGAAVALLIYCTSDQLLANRPLLDRMLQ
jgi:hypothetical protein